MCNFALCRPARSAIAALFLLLPATKAEMERTVEAETIEPRRRHNDLRVRAPQRIRPWRRGTILALKSGALPFDVDAPNRCTNKANSLPRQRATRAIPNMRSDEFAMKSSWRGRHPKQLC